MLRSFRENWAKSRCSFGWFMKKYSCYHIIALAANLEYIEIPNMYENVNIEKKTKRGRKSKAGPWFEKTAHN